MKKAKIYKPTKTAMQSGLKKFDKWVLEYITDDPTINPLMGWEVSTDAFDKINLEFDTQELAIQYAKKNKIDFEMTIDKPIYFDENDDLKTITLSLNNWLEKMIVKNPDQWIWSHNRWK